MNTRPATYWVLALVLALASACGPSKEELTVLDNVNREVRALSSEYQSIQTDAWYLLGQVKDGIDEGSVEKADSAFVLLERLHPTSDYYEEAKTLRQMR